jgi:phospholipid transport system substrate-binding protein
MLKRFVFFVAASLFVTAATASDLAPDALVKQVAQDVLTQVKKDKDIQSGSRKKIYDLVQNKILPYFDFNKMTSMAVGAKWRSATPEQQKKLEESFRDLLVGTYAMSLAKYKDQTIEYLPLTMQPGDSRVVVKTLIHQKGGEDIPVNYKMNKGPDGWKVYDVVIADVSLVITYRGEFSDVVSKSGIDGLIKRLEEKNNAPAKQS